MKKSTKIILSVFLFLLAGFFIFQNRISGTYKIFQLSTELTSLMSEGSDNYNLHISAGMRTADHLDTLNAYLSYKNNVHFTANVDYNKDKYIIHNNQDSTSVYVSKSNLLISGKNTSNGEFDIVKLVGSILSDYPDTDFIPSMSWSKRAGLSAWLFFKAGFKKQVINNQVYHVIILPEDSPLEGAELWLNDQQNDYFLNVKNEGQQIGLHISLTDTQAYEQLPLLETTKRINVNGKELNTAIYRGALRTGGLLLENMNPPKPDGIDRKWGKGMLTYVNNNRVLIAKGSHYEIGEAHGALLKEEIRKLVDAT